MPEQRNKDPKEHHYRLPQLKRKQPHHQKTQASFLGVPGS
jgi:hypothetical protein